MRNTKPLKVAEADWERVADVLADCRGPVLEAIQKYEQPLSNSDLLMLSHNLHKYLFQKLVLEKAPEEFREALINMAEATWVDAMYRLRQQFNLPICEAGPPSPHNN